MKVLMVTPSSAIYMHGFFNVQVVRSELILQLHPCISEKEKVLRAF